MKDTECLTMLGHSGAVYGACFVPGNKYLVSASEDTTGMELQISELL